MYNAQKASLRAPTVLRGVVALCCGVNNKVQNSLHGGGEYSNWELENGKLRRKG